MNILHSESRLRHTTDHGATRADDAGGALGPVQDGHRHRHGYVSLPNPRRSRRPSSRTRRNCCTPLVSREFYPNARHPPFPPAPQASTSTSSAATPSSRVSAMASPSRATGSRLAATSGSCSSTPTASGASARRSKPHHRTTTRTRLCSSHSSAKARGPRAWCTRAAGASFEPFTGSPWWTRPARATGTSRRDGNEIKAR